ncbi:hypothetical protein VTN02DRAFT_3778 [Thermoascus thermophilus]
MTARTRPTASVASVADRPFDNILNFRDVGGSINQICGSRILQEGVLFRSARPDDASERDRKRLVDELGISTIIDLRSTTEHIMATEKRRSAMSLETDAEAAAVMADPDEHLLELPGVRRFALSLTGRAFEKALLWRLDWFTLIKVLALTASGYRQDAVSIVGREALRPRGLIGLAQDTLDCSADEMRELFDVLAHDETYPTVVHCTQGKDRTGLVVLLLLLLTRAVPVDVIGADYVRSELEVELDERALEERTLEMRAVGLPDDYARCPPGWTQAVTDYLDERYRGVEGYLLSLGIDREKQGRIRRRLLV